MIPPEITEVNSTARTPDEEVRYHARQKAEALADQYPDAVIIGSDTLIHFQGEKIGKPNDGEEAKAILRRLSGHLHEVVTGIAIAAASACSESRTEKKRQWIERVETVRIQMRDYSAQEIDTYVARGESLDKAGAYSLQGAGRALIASLDGDYLAAVGLPLRAVAEGLRRCGVRLQVDVEVIYQQRNVLNWQTFVEK
jgi:septum formation protein